MERRPVAESIGSLQAAHECRVAGLWRCHRAIHDFTPTDRVPENPRTSGAAASPVMWKKRSGAFFRLVKCTTSRPPWQAATGGTRHGEEYQGSWASAGA